MVCEKCRKNKQVSEFMPTTSPFWPNNHINVCYECIEGLVDGNDMNQVDRLFQHANMAFLPNEWRKIWVREGSGSFRKYANMYYDINYYKYDWTEQNQRLMELAEKGLIETELDELKPAFVAELKATWGDLPEIDLLRLEKLYNASIGDYNVEKAIHQDQLRKMARMSIIIDQGLTKGKVDKDMMSAYDRLVASINKSLEDAASTGVSVVSQLVEFIERNGYKPTFYEGVPRDEIDMIEENVKTYLKDLVEGEVNLTDMYERRKQKLQEKLEKVSEEDE